MLTIIGDGPEKNKLKLLSHKLQINNRVNFIGYQKKAVVADVIRDHDALVLSSDVETFGVVLVEAMTVGLPVIATKCGGPESIVLPETGILVEPNNSTELYTAMKHIIDMAKDRGAYICQSQSLNLWMEEPSYKSLTSMHFYSWEAGLKTGIYYLRRKAKHQAQQFTIEPDKKAVQEDENEVCEMCSA